MRDSHNPFEIINNQLLEIKRIVLEVKNAPKQDYSIIYYTKKQAANLLSRSTQTLSMYHLKGWIKIEDLGPRGKRIHHYQIFNEDNTLKHFPPKRKA